MKDLSMSMRGLLLAAAATTAAGTHLVWPPPQHITSSGEPLALHPQFAVRSASASGRLAAAIARHSATTIGPALAAQHAALGGSADQNSERLLRELQLIVRSPSEALGMATDYSYNLTVSGEATPPRAEVRCASIYGCMYGLESFAQLLDTQRGTVLHSSVQIVDVRTAPRHLPACSSLLARLLSAAMSSIASALADC